MKKTELLFNRITKQHLIALLTPGSVEECLEAYKVLDQNNITLEIAFRSEFALDGIKKIIEEFPDALILAGTVMTAEQANEAIKAGASGIISADYIPDVADVCCGYDIMYIPGGLNDAGKQLTYKTECYECTIKELKESYPYQWIYKLFPVVSGDTSFAHLAKAWKGPYKDLTIVYTGGVDLNNLLQLYKNDPNGIFCASAITKNLSNKQLFLEDIRRWKDKLKVQDVQIDQGVQRDDKSQLTTHNSPLTSAIVTFGEYLLRLSSEPGVRLGNAQNLIMNYGGAEANVAVSLAQFGLNSRYISAVPKNHLGDNGIRQLRSFGVDVEYVIRKGDRLGLYFLEHGAGPRPSKVIYDRSNSSFANIKPGDYNWDEIFENANWFHWTGITPAVGDNVVEVLREAISVAKSKGITISTDLNYRKKLWSIEKARSIMNELLMDVDVLFTNEEDPKILFDISDKLEVLDQGKIDLGIYETICRQLVEMFGFKKVAITLRESISASENNWSACLYSDYKLFMSPEYNIQVVDRVGSGDAFAAGLINGILNGKSSRETLNFATAVSCLKHTIKGDFNIVSVKEVEYLMAGFKGGRVQR